MRVLIIVDAQNDFINGSLGSEAAQAVVPKIVEKIEWCTEPKILTDPDGYQVLFEDYDVYVTYDTHYKYEYLDTLEGEKLPIKHCVVDADDDGWFLNPKIEEALKRCTEDRYVEIEKSTFGSTYLPMLLKQEGKYSSSGSIEVIELVGYDLDICVMSNALILKAFFPDVPIVVDASCCAASSPENFDAAVKILRACHVDVIGLEGNQ